METTHLSERIGSRSKVKVIGVAEDDRCVEFPQRAMIHGFDRALGAHRHKDRRWDLSMVSHDPAGASAT